jgi:hypothetical protein
MMPTKKQMQKKKAREEKGRARSAARRHKLQQISREERHKAALDRKFREKIAPVVKDPQKKLEMEEAEKKKALGRLQRNAEILKALEEEYERDLELKKSVNDALEAEGHFDLKDKVTALEAKARESMSTAESETGAIDLSEDA